MNKEDGFDAYFLIIIYLSCISIRFNINIYGVYLWDIYLGLGLLLLIVLVRQLYILKD